MKRFLFIALCLTLCLSMLAACGETALTEQTSGSEQTTAVPGDTTAENTTAGKTSGGDVVYTPEEAYNLFRTTCFAEGLFSDTVLDNVNPGVIALISDCLYFEDTLQKYKAKGDRWVYSNSSSYVPQKTTFDEMIASGKHGTNCAMGVGWSLLDMNVLVGGQRFWGHDDGSWRHRNDTEAEMGAVCEIYSYGGTRTFAQLFDEGQVKAGDMFLVKGHTFLYLGDEKFFAMGHDSHYHIDATASSEYGDSTAVFDSFIVNMRECSNYSKDIYWLFRFKDEFVPHYYRNAEGKNVVNPMYNENTRSEYNKRKDPNQATIIYMHQDELCKQNKKTPAKVEYSIPKAATAPVIDGVGGEEWKDALKIDLTLDNTVDEVSSNLECQGGSFYYLWDENALYMLAEINDATPSERKSTAGNGSYNELDGVQICLYVDKQVKSPTANKLFFFSFCPEADDGKPYAGEHFIYSNGSKGKDVPEIELKSTKTDVGYVVEVKIPASVFAKANPEIKLEAGTSFPMCNVILDTDNYKSAIFADTAWFNAPNSNNYTLK